MRRSGAAAVARRDSVSAPRPLIGCGALSWRAPSSEKPPLYPLSNRRAPPPPLLPPMPPPAPPLPLATRGSPDVPARGADVTTTYGDDVFPACPAWASPQGTVSVSAPAVVGEASAVGPMSSAATTSAARARSAAGTPRSSSATGVRRRPGLSSRLGSPSASKTAMTSSRPSCPMAFILPSSRSRSAAARAADITAGGSTSSMTTNPSVHRARTASSDTTASATTAAAALDATSDSIPASSLTVFRRTCPCPCCCCCPCRCWPWSLPRSSAWL
mmetsp:Transcript_19753/g.48942  ORF Transcript_19753/g.48942 Transcript_19753/m.48942 type:complete len:273 (+) Transcript_19753:955-1773(+)